MYSLETTTPFIVYIYGTKTFEKTSHQIRNTEPLTLDLLVRIEKDGEGCRPIKIGCYTIVLQKLKHFSHSCPHLPTRNPCFFLKSCKNHSSSISSLPLCAFPFPFVPIHTTAPRLVHRHRPCDARQTTRFLP